jgi:uncharacterized protein (DUF736 family)
MEEKKNEYIGALWIKVTNNGKQFMSGNIEIDGKKTEISLWHNDYKKDNQPDYRIKINDYKKEPVMTDALKIMKGEDKFVTVEDTDILPF